MNPRFAPSWTRFFCNSDKDSGGAGKAPTVQELADKLKAAEDAKAGLQSQLDAEKGKVTNLETANTALTQRAEKAEGQVTALTKEVGDLKAADKSAQQRQAEIAAANGVAPVEKPADAAKAPEGDAALWEKYAAADATEQARMRDTLGDKLDKAAAAFDARSKK